MSWQFVALDEVPASPWRNGGGVTRELLAWPAVGPWRLRISVADIEADGPFSAFPAIERWFAVLEGQGVELRVNGSRQRLGRGSEPFRFDGGAAVDCALLAGSTRDFNLMARPGAATLRRIGSPVQMVCGARRLVALYSHRAGGRLGLGTESIEVPPATLAWQVLDAAGEVKVESGDGLWMEVAV
jgi:hypothetical protein